MTFTNTAYTLYYYIFYLKTNAKVSKKTATFYVTCNGNHKYGNPKVTKAATCTQEGTMLYTCTGCGATKTTPIPAAHAWNSGKVVLEPTVSKQGAKDCVCTVCGKSGRVATPAIFSDVQDDWYTNAVQYAYDNGLMTGIKGTTKFEPNSNITKAQVAQVLYNMENKPHTSANRVFDELKDVFEGEWYAEAVSWAYNTGIVTGDTNARKFFPNANVTREQLALMLYRYAEYKGYDTSHWDDLSGLKNKENVSNWATTAVEWAVGAKLISGIDKNGVKDLAPGGNASRAQVATILMRFVEGIVSAP